MEFDGKIENSETTLPVSEAERKGEKGVTTVEYAVMLVLIAIAVMVANSPIDPRIQEALSACRPSLRKPGAVRGRRGEPHRFL